MSEFNKETVLCVEIGGSHVCAARANVSPSDVALASTVVHRNTPESGHAPASETLAHWRSCVREAASHGDGAEGSERIAGVAVAMPGPALYDAGGVLQIVGLGKFDRLFG